MKKRKLIDCPKCKANKSVKITIYDKDTVVETSIFRCTNKECNHQALSFDELTTKTE